MAYWEEHHVCSWWLKKTGAVFLWLAPWFFTGLLDFGLQGWTFLLFTVLPLLNLLLSLWVGLLLSISFIFSVSNLAWLQATCLATFEELETRVVVRVENERSVLSNDWQNFLKEIRDFTFLLVLSWRLYAAIMIWIVLRHSLGYFPSPVLSETNLSLVWQTLQRRGFEEASA